MKHVELFFVVACFAAWLATGCEFATLHPADPQTVQAARQTAPPVAKAVSAQAAANKVSAAMIVAAVACAVLSGFAFYAGHVWPGIKFALAAVCLPICAVWFSQFWAWIVGGVFVSLGLWLLVTHYAVVKPVLDSIEGVASKIP